MAGTEIVIDGAANPRFNRCEFNGEFGQPISITNGNYDKDNLSLILSLYDNTLNYVIMKNMGQRYVDIDYSRINNSEFYLSDNNNGVSWNYVSINDSYIKTPESFVMYYSEVNHSKLEYRRYGYMSSSIVNNSYIQSNGYRFSGDSNTIISNSVIDAKINNIGKVNNSIYQNNYIRDGNTFFKNVDFEKVLSVGNENTFFFDGVAILNQDKVIDYGYGNPEDREGDGIAETQICVVGSCITIDGVNNPRTVRNFSNGVHDLWDMRNVGTGIIEPGIATAVINTPLYIQMPMKEGNDLYQGLFNFNADGTFTYKSYIAQVGASEWMEDFDGDGNGYWYVSNDKIYFTWLNGRGIWASISVAIDDNGKVIFDGQTASDVSLPPKTEQEMVDDGFAYYRLSGVAKFKDYTGRWIRIAENTNAYVDSFNGLINMPIDSTTGVFGFDGWLIKDQFNANNATTVYVYHDDNLNGIYNYDERLGYASYQSRQFGNNETPLVLTYLSEGIETNDLKGRTYYRIKENNDGSLEMMSAYLSSQSTALYKFYSAHYGDKRWTYLGNDCEQLGCIPTKEDITGTWSIDSNQVSQTIADNVTSYSYIDGILMLSHYINEYYQISKADIDINIVAKRSIGSSYQYGKAYLNEVIYMDKPLVPVNQSQINDKLERISSTIFDSNYFDYSYYQPVLEKYVDNNSNEYLNYSYQILELLGDYKQIYNSKTLNRYNDSYGWYWNANGISDNAIRYSNLNYHQDGSLELLNADTTVAKKIWAVTAPDNNTRIVQYDGDYPVLWTHDVPDMSDNGIQLPPKSLLRLAVNLIEGNTWINHVSGNTFIEMEFLPSNILLLTKISWINDEWITVGNEVRTSWSDKDGYLTFDFDGKEQRLHIISLGTDAAGLWELNSGDAQVWLAERPKFINSAIIL
ncbi:hypothetical protein [Photobacterium phosphoreum]|uniref:hypothetical protein n=1 Tax=Photobacterium phosphoreum TaxID=659 RepID=UPI000D17E1F1|nr:hypothetical protein [Photobacterium phosphoreum]PTB32834.1 hypothetical protein DAT36_09800 [Photobacterium phosphoreum]